MAGLTPFIHANYSGVNEPERNRVALSAHDMMDRGLIPHITVNVRRTLKPGPTDEYRSYSNTVEDVTNRCRFADEVNGFVDLYLRDKDGNFYLNEYKTDAAMERVWGWVMIELRSGAPARVAAAYERLRQRRA
jgi:hypothetical protein